MAENDVFKYPPTPGSVLPTGAATEAKQDVMIQELQDIEAKVSTEAKQDTIISELGAIKTDTGAIDASTASLDSKITKADTDDVTVTSSVLPTGAATEAKQDLMVFDLDNIATLSGEIAQDVLEINLKVSTAAKQDNIISELQDIESDIEATNTKLDTLNGKVTAVNTGNVTVAASALPTGAATSAKQDTQTSYLMSIETQTYDTKMRLPPSLGSQVGYLSFPVIVSPDQGDIGVITKNSLVTAAYDAIIIDTTSDPTTDFYHYMTGGTGGTQVAEIRVSYSDATKSTIVSVERL